MKIIGKKGSSDAYTQTTQTIHLSKILIISLVLFLIFIIAVLGYIDSLAPIPVDLEEDLVIARLTNVCLAATYPGTDTMQQNIIDVDKVTKESLDSCFVDDFGLTVRLTSNDDKINLYTSVGSTATNQYFVRYVLIKTPDGIIPGVLKVSL